MSKKKIIIISLLLLVLVSAVVVYNYAYQDHRDIRTENATFTVTAKDLIAEFTQSPDVATKKYLDQTIAITGTVTEINKNNITINNSIFARFDQEVTTKDMGNIQFKGRCIGYDDLLEEIRFEQCFLIN